jgi:thiamine-monophosphate kinase
MSAKSRRLDSATLAGLGENGLIQLLTRRWRGGRGVRVGVGDDCAVLDGGRKGEWLLYKTDAVVEEVHFTAKTAADLIGRKALARAVSDVAAMGGSPWSALITIGIPPETKPQRIRGIYRGLEKLAREYDVSLVGGETTRASKLFLSVSLLGRMKTEPVLRSTGRAGDLLFVTGKLGRTIPGKHLKFKPRVAEGQWLARKGFARSMMDLSDGLGADLPRLAAASGVGYRIEREALPRNPGASVVQALNDGEDYELLFSVAPGDVRRLLSQWPFELALTCVGALTKGKTNEIRHGGYDHFKQR